MPRQPRAADQRTPAHARPLLAPPPVTAGRYGSAFPPAGRVLDSLAVPRREIGEAESAGSAPERLLAGEPPALRLELGQSRPGRAPRPIVATGIPARLASSR